LEFTPEKRNNATEKELINRKKREKLTKNKNETRRKQEATKISCQR
jgi:hypothetical protein